ncbi:MAG: ACT domain-containing protein [Stygiobacter sp.]|uniref:ACT domain-containing protein n=1 Tax=Stygiobacter electus TaxID=3032292 RepID=A0AAE3P2V6_9BACT|nr:ACT domain-containing protein [Stygiobacter electus]MDF1612772.1 ACT domain-containing protein [Stygiobacter electus]
MKLSENEIRKITYETIEELGTNVSQEVIKEAVKKKVESLNNFPLKHTNENSGKVILTSFGLNKPGIVAAITTALGNFNCDIQDLSQRIIGDFFTIIMIIDISTSQKDLKEIQEEMRKTAEQLNIKIYLQHEDVFRFMHRI